MIGMLRLFGLVGGWFIGEARFVCLLVYTIYYIL